MEISALPTRVEWAFSTYRYRHMCRKSARRRGQILMSGSYLRKRTLPLSATCSVSFYESLTDEQKTRTLKGQLRKRTISALGQKQTFAVQHVNVRFTPNSGHVRCNYVCLLWANSGHSAIHSITSSASSKNNSGGERPSALAVLRLITSSNLTGDCTDRLPGNSPLENAINV